MNTFQEFVLHFKISDYHNPFVYAEVAEAALAPFSASFVFLASAPPSAGSDFFLFLTMCEMSLVAPFVSGIEDEFGIENLNVVW